MSYSEVIVVIKRNKTRINALLKTSEYQFLFIVCNHLQYRIKYQKTVYAINDHSGLINTPRAKVA